MVLPLKKCIILCKLYHGFTAEKIDSPQLYHGFTSENIDNSKL